MSSVKAMSTDRIVFQIPIKRLLDPRYVGAVMQAFGLPRSEVPVETAEVYRNNSHTDVAWEITCRPSQFGRFIVYRAHAGCQNMIQELRVKIVEAQMNKPTPLRAEPIDVSRRPKLQRVGQ